MRALIGTVIVIATASVAGAQPKTPPPPRIGIIPKTADAPPPTTPAPVGAIAPIGMPEAPPPSRANQVVAAGSVPVLVLADGSVLADFGRGWERVIRSCVNTPGGAAAQPAPMQPSATQPTVAQPNANTPTTTPRAGSIGLIPPTPAPAASAPAPPPAGSCWMQNTDGRVVVIR